jgi:hypothetical protein
MRTTTAVVYRGRRANLEVAAGFLCVYERIQLGRSAEIS